jgi:hypothetical protein
LGSFCSTRVALSLTALVIVPWALCATFKQAQDSTRVTLSPRLGMSPLTVQLRVSIDHPSEDWYCPALTVTWADGTESKRESDCPVWDEIPEHYYYSETLWKRLGGGVHDISVNLRQGAKSRVFTVRVEVSGDD